MESSTIALIGTGADALDKFIKTAKTIRSFSNNSKNEWGPNPRPPKEWYSKEVYHRMRELNRKGENAVKAVGEFQSHPTTPEYHDVVSDWILGKDPVEQSTGIKIADGMKFYNKVLRAEDNLSEAYDVYKREFLKEWTLKTLAESKAAIEHFHQHRLEFNLILPETTTTAADLLLETLEVIIELVQKEYGDPPPAHIRLLISEILALKVQEFRNTIKRDFQAVLN